MQAIFRLCVLFLFLFQMTLSAEEATPVPTPTPTEPTQQIEMVEPEAPADAVVGITEDRPQPPTYEGAFLKMILVLALLLFIIFFVIWAVRRFTHARMGLFKDTKHIRIIDRRPLSPKTALYLIEIGDKRVLVAESQLEVKGLTTIETTSGQET